MPEYRICKRCVMDTTEKIISFDEHGYCSYCTHALKDLETGWKRNGEAELAQIFDKIKAENAEKEYDCIIGISGGIDSSYVAYIGHKYGLRMLGIHIDAGWDTPVASVNIKKLCTAYGIDLKCIKINHDEMMDLQRAYFFSGVPNQDVPQDHAFFAMLYRYAIENHVKYVLSGSNLSSESILGFSLSYDAKDSINLLDIHRKFGRRKLVDFPIMDHQTFYKDIPSGTVLKILEPLNYLDYDKEKAIEFLHTDCGFEYYGGKHQESLFTRLFQNYIQPVKYGQDKRRAHLSSLIIAGQLSREEALEILKKPAYANEELLEHDIRYFIDNIGITREEFEKVMKTPYKSHYCYKTNKPGWKNRSSLVMFIRNSEILQKIKKWFHA